MIDVAPVEIPATAAGTTAVVAPVYRYLMRQPDHWLRQAFFVGRPKLPISRVVEAMHANGHNLEETARGWGLPIAAVEEALDYYRRFRDVIEADADNELALSEELVRQRSAIS